MAFSRASTSSGSAEVGRRQVLAQMGDRRGAGDQQDVGRALQQPGERHLHRRRAELAGDVGQRRRLQRREAAEREERHVGDALPRPARRSARRRRGARGCTGSARRRSSAMPRASRDLRGVTLLRPMWRIRPCRCSSASAVSGASIEPSAGPWTSNMHAQVDDVEHVEAEVAQVVVHRAASAPRARRPGSTRRPSPRRAPTLVTITRSSRIGMQRLADDLVGDVRAVEVAGVDVVDAARDRLAQHGERGVAVLRRPEHAGPGELHGAVAEALHGAVAEREGAGLCR